MKNSQPKQHFAPLPEKGVLLYYKIPIYRVFALNDWKYSKLTKPYQQKCKVFKCSILFCYEHLVSREENPNGKPYMDDINIGNHDLLLFSLIFFRNVCELFSLNMEYLQISPLK